MKLSTTFMVIGAVMILFGIVALINPFAASLAVTTMVGMMFLLIGVVLAWVVFNNRGSGRHITLWIIAFLNILIGVWLIANPLQGTVSLTMMLGIFFLLAGFGRIGMAQRAGGRTKKVLVVSGVASVIVALLVLLNIGGASAGLLGVLLALELLTDGIGLAALGAVLRKKLF